MTKMQTDIQHFCIQSIYCSPANKYHRSVSCCQERWVIVNSKSLFPWRKPCTWLRIKTKGIIPWLARTCKAASNHLSCTAVTRSPSLAPSKSCIVILLEHSISDSAEESSFTNAQASPTALWAWLAIYCAKHSFPSHSWAVTVQTNYSQLVINFTWMILETL